MSDELKEIFCVTWASDTYEMKDGLTIRLRYDGCSLHLTREDAKTFVNKFYSNLSLQSSEEIEDEIYDGSGKPHPVGEPYAIQVNQGLYDRISNSASNLLLTETELEKAISSQELFIR